MAVTGRSRTAKSGTRTKTKTTTKTAGARAPKSKFNYRGKSRTVEGLARRSKSSGAFDSYLISDANFYKAKEGENSIRILPLTWEDTDTWGEWWEIRIFVHYGIGPDNSAYLCLDKMKGEVCPICEARRASDDEKERQELRPVERALCWVIDRDSEKSGPLAWAMPVASLAKDINYRSEDKENKSVLFIDDPEDGYDVTYIKEGTKLRTKYTGVEIARHSTPLSEDSRKMAKWLKYIEEHPLPDMLQFYDADHIEKVLYGQAAETDEDEEEDTGKSRSRGRGKGSPFKDDEEEDTGPRGRRRLAKDDDEEEEEPEDEEGEEEEDDGEEEEEPEEEEEDDGEEEEEDDGEGEEEEDDEDDADQEEEDDGEEDEEDEPEEEEEPDEPAPKRARRALGKLNRRATGKGKK